MFSSKRVAEVKKHPFLVLFDHWSQAIASRKYWKKKPNKPRYTIDADFLSVMRSMNTLYTAYMNNQEDVAVPEEVSIFIDQNMGNVPEGDFEDFLVSNDNFDNTSVDELVDAVTIFNGKLQTQEIRRDIKYATAFGPLIDWFAVAVKNNYKQEVFDAAQNAFYLQPSLSKNLGQFYKAMEK
jgi:hypothetical protein